MSANAAQDAGRTTGPKVLRIGIIQNGKIIEERLLRKRGAVTIGHHPKNTFHIPAADIPRSAPLFEVKGNDLQLIFDDKMEGRVSLGDGVHDLDSLRKGGKATKTAGGYCVTINERSRGKIVLGEVTVLFQFVAPPPLSARPQLPATMRAGWIRNLDWNLLIILAISALVQGGSVWWVQAQDWPEPRDIKGLPDRFVQVLAPPEIEEPKKPEEDIELAKVEGEGDAKPEEPKEEPKKAADKKPVDPDRQAAQEANRKKALSKTVENKTILKQLGAVTDGGGSLVDALAGGAGRRGLDEAFAGSTGVQTGSAGAERSGIHRVGSSDATGEGSKANIGDLKARGAENIQVDTGDKAPATQVKARVNLRSTESVVGSGVVDKKALSAVFRARGSALQSCYERELKKNPSLSGKVVIRFTIGPAGRVTSASVLTHMPGSNAVGDCVASRVQGWKFPSPEGGSVTVSKSILFAADK
jgi:TonB family protein